ncbi:MAG: hypothetical protein MJ244_05130 [Clostridia bacterium]|nr:hypothetical protein [Clostridia bacterium]
MAKTKKSTKKVVKEVKSSKKTLKQLIKQDKKILEKYCTSKCFKTIHTIEEQLIDCLSNPLIQRHIKTKVLDVVRAGTTNNGALKIELIFNNDATLYHRNNHIKETIDSFIEFLEKKVKEESEN